MNSPDRDRHPAEFHQMQRSIAELLLYQDVLDNEVGRTLVELLDSLAKPVSSTIAAGDRSQSNILSCLSAYGRFFKALAQEKCNWEEYLIDRVLQAENPFSLQVQAIDPIDREASLSKHLSPSLLAAAKHDLECLHHLYICGQYLPHWVERIGGRPVCRQSRSQTLAGNELYGEMVAKMFDLNWSELVADLANYYHHNGVGIFGQYRAFKWQHELIGIRHFDRVRIGDLVGYELQKQTLVDNTQALLAGKPALNILLYGGKGTGKSSLIKGLLNEFGDSQLRAIEVSKSQMINLSQILDRIANLPQKFIIFIDDLSFEEDDEAFKALKVVLEGSIIARPANVVVYATSNRRHLVREYFADRPRPQDADEVQMWDTVQEKLSFSDRFGITLTFEPADQPKYLEIVNHLADSAQLPIDRDDLEKRALQWATRHNGRSGRTARQFIDYLSGKQP